MKKKAAPKFLLCEIAGGKKAKATHANHIGWSDREPYEIVRIISDKMIEIRHMKATIKKEFKPDFHPGGFVGHVSNQNDQDYVYESTPEAPIVKARLRKDGYWYSRAGRHRLMDRPFKFYDYNF